MRSVVGGALIAACAAATVTPAGAGEPGYASAVTDPGLMSTLTSRFERDLRALGIPAAVQSCRLMERVAVGVRDSDNAFGAACKVSFGGGKPKELLLCDDDFGESFGMVASSFADTPDWMAGFVRKTCF